MNTLENNMNLVETLMRRDNMSREEVIEIIENLANAIQSIPDIENALDELGLELDYADEFIEYIPIPSK